MSIHTEVTQEDSQTIAGNNIFSGTNTFSGPIISSNNNSFTGSNSFGSFISSTTNSVVEVSATNVQGWAGSDVGAWINAAAASAACAGTCKIHIAKGVYPWSTQLSIAAVNKYVTLVGDGEGVTVLTWSPTSGVAAILAGGQGNTGGIHLEDMSWRGPGLATSTTAVQWGSASVGISGATVKSMEISSFGTALDYVTGIAAYLIQVQNSHVIFNGKGANLAGEDNQFFGGTFSSNTIAFNITGSTGTEAVIHGVAMDDNGSAVTCSNPNGRISDIASRYENPSLTTSDQYWNISGGCTISKRAGAMQDDAASGSNTGFVQITGTSQCDLDSVWVWTAGRTQTQIVNLSGSAQARIVPIIASANFTNLYNPAYIGGSVTAWRMFDSQNIGTNIMTISGSLPRFRFNDIESTGHSYDFRAVVGGGCPTAGEQGIDIIAGTQGGIPGSPKFGFCEGTGTPRIAIWGSGSGTATLQAPATGGVSSTLPSTAGVLGVVIASGTAAMTTAAITAGNCGTTVTVAAANVATTDQIFWSFNAAPAGSNAGLVSWPTSGNVNFAYCPNSAETPAAATINWKVVR